MNLFKGLSILILILGIQNVAFATITSKAKNRMSKVLGHEKWFYEDIQIVPTSLKGLGNHWYPILIESNINLSEIKTTVYPTINPFNGRSLDYSEETVIKNIVSTIMETSYPIDNNISKNEIFLDPKKIKKAIENLKSEEETTFIGFMPYTGFFEMNIDGEKLKFKMNTSNFQELRFETANYYIQYQFKLREKRRIFGIVLKIKIIKKI